MLDRVAIVIPVGPGDAAWRGLLAQLGTALPQPQIRLVACREDEVDAAHALPVGTRWLIAARGRARQLNAGVRDTDRDFLWFLHADTRLAPRADADPRPAIDALERTLCAGPTGLGYFDLTFLDDGPRAMAINAFGAYVRSRWLGMPFGDQGLFLARSTFERLGGFDESLALAEDHALVWRARRDGVALLPARARLYTSARKYAERGWLRTTARHLALTFAQARRFSRPSSGNVS
jgi:hypothetical protein